MSTLHGFAIVTGAASGVGRATAKALVQAGVTGIALLDINATGLEETKSQLHGNVRTYVCDISSPEAVEETYNAVHKEFGRIDYALHCAGIVVFGPSLGITVDDFDLQNRVIYRGLWLCQRAAIRLMREQSLNNEAYPEGNIPAYRAQRGAITNICSALALTSSPFTPAYAGAKAGVLAVTRSDALDYVSDRIRINAVLPGLLDTPMSNPNPETRKMLEDNALPLVPMKRFGSPEEVADVMVFLSSTAASFVTGAGWLVDGGYLIN